MPRVPIEPEAFGPQRHELQALAAQTVPGRAEFVGHQNREELYTTVEGVRFAVLPSEWYEDYPYTVLQAYTAGKPVIASDRGGIPEPIDEGQDGPPFEAGNVPELADRIRLLMHDDARLLQPGEKAKAKIEDIYGADAHCTQFMGIRSALIKGRAPLGHPSQGDAKGSGNWLGGIRPSNRMKGAARRTATPTRFK